MARSEFSGAEEVEGLIARFGTEDWQDAYETMEGRLEAAGPGRTEQLLETVIRGFDHENPDVRKWCVALLDHHATADCLEPLIETLEDPKTAVRRHAVHSIGCQSCKEDPLDVDVVGLLVERAASDASIRVRRSAVHMLGNQPPEERAAQFLTELLETTGDEKLRRNAQWALDQQTQD